MENPFAVVGDDSDRTLAGRRLGTPLREHPDSDLTTHIAVCGSQHGNGRTVMMLTGVMWEPQPGAVVQLSDPNRDATVCSVRYGVAPDGQLHSVVFLHDPETTSTEAEPVLDIFVIGDED